MSIDKRPVLRVGSLAYWDSMSGMIPCKVTAIAGKSGSASSEQTVTFRLTADRGVYKRGETFTAWALHIVPRDAYFKRRIGAHIGYYTVEV